jgi:hypothetical protein
VFYAPPWKSRRWALTVQISCGLQNDQLQPASDGGSAKEARMKRQGLSRRANFSVKGRLDSAAGPNRVVDIVKTQGPLDDSITNLRELTLALRRMLGLHQIAE